MIIYEGERRDLKEEVEGFVKGFLSNQLKVKDVLRFEFNEEVFEVAVEVS